MLSFILTNAAGLVAAAIPTPKPLPSVSSAPLFAVPQETFGSQHPFILTLVQTLFVICAVGLVGLMAIQTTKNEGLSGTIGGRAESAYRGRLGLDQQLRWLTSAIATAFVVLSILYFLVTR